MVGRGWHRRRLGGGLYGFRTFRNPVIACCGAPDAARREIPFLRTRRFFFADPEMLYEVAEARHLEPVEYVIAGLDRREVEIAADGASVDYRRDGVLLRWQFSPRPVLISASGNEIRSRFEASQVETLFCWSATGVVAES